MRRVASDVHRERERASRERDAERELERISGSAPVVSPPRGHDDIPAKVTLGKDRRLYYVTGDAGGADPGTPAPAHESEGAWAAREREAALAMLAEMEGIAAAPAFPNNSTAAR